jgi:outer membrane receptor for ferrienterochelin and colicins
MKSLKPVFEFRIVVLLVAFVLGMSGITEGASQQLTGDDAEAPPRMLLAETGVDSEPLLLAVKHEGAEDDEELLELLAVLEEETEVATKTKMNADYVPGIVTVLHGDVMEAKGARTVWEALGFVPGVETRINDQGRPMVVVRGISGSGHTGNMQLMINSVGANSSFRGVNDSLMMIPIEQVERIEVIRGSGSSLYGEFAYSGVVNIIIRKEGKRLYGSAARFDAYGAGGLYSYANPERDLKLSVNVAGWATDGADVNSGIDKVEANTGQTDISFSPGPTNEDEKVRSLAINLDYKKTSLSFYGVNRKYGDYFGTGGTLNSGSDGTPKDDLYWHLDLRQKLKINSALNGVLKVSISEDEKEDKQMRLPPGAITNPPPPPPGAPPPPGPPPVPIFFPDGEFKTNYIKERRIEGGVDFTWSGWNGHEWLLGLSAAEVEVRDAWEASNVDHSTVPKPTVFPTIQRLPEDQDVWIDAGQKRRILSAVLQDQFELSDNFTLTVAARYDDFDDVGDAVTPRIAAVWKVGEPHLLKFQYSEAYRPPSLHELYLPETGVGPHGNPDVKPETSKTWEAGYIYRQPGVVGRATLFYSKMEDLIVIWRGAGVEEHRPINSDEVDLKGGEIEIEKQFGKRWKTMANLSFLDAKDKTNHQDVVNSTELIGNIVIEGKIADNLLAVINYRHVGDRKRGSDDTRDDLDGYDTVDLTANCFNLGLKGLTFRIGVKNIFDADVKAPSNFYQDDLPRPGRTWWTQVSYDF